MTDLSNLVGAYSDKIKTGQDLIDSGVVPKTSSCYLALIVQDRLQKLATYYLSQTNGEMLGEWIPVVKYTPEAIQKRAELNSIDSLTQTGVNIEGYVVRATGTVKGVDLTGVEGVIISSDRLTKKATIKWDTPKTDNAGAQVAYIQTLDLDAGSIGSIKLTGTKKTSSLSMGVVADKQLGHKVMFKEGYSGPGRVDAGYKPSVLIQPGEIGILEGYDKSTNSLNVRLNNKTINLSLHSISDTLMASSLGQIAPLDSLSEVKNQALSDFFPKTRLDPAIAEQVIVSLLMGKDVIFFGPPGSGKTNLVDDILNIAELQEVYFTVPGCQSNCNPFSIFDKEYSKVVPPCPKCAIKYDKPAKGKFGFKETGIFTRPDAKDVPVVVSAYTLGKAIEFLQGSEKLQRMHLAGYKLPRMDGPASSEADESDPDGFHPGALVRTNNGILHISELGNIRNSTLDDLLDALQGFFIKPDELRHNFPTNSIIYGTTNETEKLRASLVDRMRLIHVPYPTDVETSHEIIKRSYYGNTVSLRAVDIDDSHKKQPNGIRHIIMPVIVEKAITAVYQEFRSKNRELQQPDIAAGNRSLLDALYASRAKLLLDKVFDSGAPLVADERYARYGIEYAIETRLQADDTNKRRELNQKFEGWLDERFLPILEGENNRFWCEFSKDLANRMAQAPSIEANMMEELKLYETNLDFAEKIYNLVLDGRPDDAPNSKAMARIKFPLMDYLFDNQPQFGNSEEISLSQVKALISYFMGSMKKSVVATK